MAAGCAELAILQNFLPYHSCIASLILGAFHCPLFFFVPHRPCAPKPPFLLRQFPWNACPWTIPSGIFFSVEVPLKRKHPATKLEGKGIKIMIILASNLGCHWEKRYLLNQHQSIQSIPKMAREVLCRCTRRTKTCSR